VRRRHQDLLEVPGVVAVVVGEHDPPQITGIHMGEHGFLEVAAVDGHPGVDQHRLGGLEQVGVDGQEAGPADRQVRR
jgi:hypothetical protein